MSPKKGHYQNQENGLPAIEGAGLKVLLCSLGLCTLGTACTNSVLVTLQALSSSTQPLPTATPSGSTGSASNPDKIVISSLSITGSGTTPGSSTTTTAGTTTIYFDSVQSTTNISSHCNSSSGSTSATKPCLCQFSWTEINSVGDTYTPVPHLVKTPLLTVQPNALTCSAPQLYFTEIADGTPINITVIAGPSNPNSGLFKTSTATYTKNPTTLSGNFQDALGRSFVNIMHYSCYNKFQRGISMTSATTDIANPDATSSFKTKTAYLGSNFCTAASGGTTSSTSATCPTLAKDFSAQTYYFNFYIRNTESGSINQYNDGFVCPLVKEPLDPSHKSGGAKGHEGQYWPMDQTFALSVGTTPDFPVGVEANTKLSSQGDPTNTGSSCSTSTSSSTSGSSTTSASGVTTSCLGFAAAVNSDGTCPYLKNSSGQLQPTYRLRKYVAIYPKLFDTNGAILEGQTQAVDTIYVLDRPVKGPVHADPLKPYTMRGPKPCPFAFYDRKGITNTVTGYPGYLGTSNSKWSGKNVDGIEFPNSDNESKKSCSATLPVPIFDQVSGNFMHWGFRTINHHLPAPFNHLYVRPITAFTPHYEEDPRFQACAPQATPLQDPPLHFQSYLAGSETYHAWCAESYPSQNDNVTAMLAGGAVDVTPFTSHSKKSSTSAECTYTPLDSLPSNYSSTGIARHLSSNSHDKTCDRSVVTQKSGWWGFPLLAPTDDVETSLKSDYSYRCTVSYDNNGPKTNTSEPKDGCCLAGVLTASPPTLGAHLEPDKACGIPNY